MKKNLDFGRPLAAFLEALSQISPSACVLGNFLLSQWLKERRRTWSVSQLSAQVGCSRNTIRTARDRMVEHGLLQLQDGKCWMLATEWSNFDQKSISSSSSNHDQGKEGTEPDYDAQILSRLESEAGFERSLAQTLLEKCPREFILKTLKNLPDWRLWDPHRPVNERVRDWPAWLFDCTMRGGLGKLGSYAQAVIRCEVAPPNAESETRSSSRASSPAQDTGGRRVAAGAATLEKASEDTAREAEDDRLQLKFERLWPALPQIDREKVIQAVRGELPTFFASRVGFEEGTVFQALLRSKAVELYGCRAPGLPWQPTTAKRDPGWSARRCVERVDPSEVKEVKKSA